MAIEGAVAPPCARQHEVTVLENRPIARDTYLLRLDDPALAQSIEPGQFLMIRPTSTNDPLLGRPFALYDVARDASGRPTGVDIVYLVLGRGTSLLSQRRVGDRLSVWGPLGHSFGAPPATLGPIALVAGGIGQTPFLALARWWRGEQPYGPNDAGFSPVSEPIRLYYGVRSADYLAGVDDFERAGLVVELATDDGSRGFRGFVTERLRRDLEAGYRPIKVLGCGPHPMLAALARLAAEFELDCDVSLENHMACGFGACFSCVAPIRGADGAVDLKRVCVEGPIFPANAVDFGASH